MSTVSIASSYVASQQAQKLSGLSDVFARQQRQEDASLIALLQEGAKNLEKVSSAPPSGLGQHIDVSA